MMNERQMKYILAIAEEGNITATAKKLYISQPSLSYMLAQVEKEVGAQLFDRSVSPLSLTYAGECYVKAAKRILSVQKELQHQIGDIQNNQQGRLSIGCGRQHSPIIFPIILPAFMSKYPGVQIKLLEERISILEDLLTSGNLELAFTTRTIHNNMLGCIPLYDEEMLLLAPRSFSPPAVIKKDTHAYPIVDLSHVNGKPFVLFHSGLHIRHIADEIFTCHGIHPNVILETSNWQTCYSIVEKGMAFSILPYPPLLEGYWTDKINCYSIDSSYDRRMSIYYRKNTYHPKIMENFIDLAQAIVNELIRYRRKYIMRSWK